MRGCEGSKNAFRRDGKVVESSVYKEQPSNLPLSLKHAAKEDLIVKKNYKDFNLSKTVITRVHNESLTLFDGMFLYDS